MTKKFSVSLPDDLHAEAVDLAQAHCTSISGLVGSALRKLIDQEAAADHAAMVTAATDPDALGQRTASRRDALREWKNGSL